MKIIVTGGAGFIGSAVIRHIIKNSKDHILNIDNLTYAGNLDNLKEVENNSRYSFIKEDICNSKSISKIFNKFKPDAVMHLAAESHVDKSINGPEEFIKTNIYGTFSLLEVSRSYIRRENKNSFKFHHISTDEVFGDLKNKNDLFKEDSPYLPSSPYSASKASSDHLVRSWFRTYKLPTIITNCSNNYGPFHFPEKLIPLTILNAISNKEIPIYGNGSQIRDWLYVDDHASALHTVITKGKIGETYNIGGNNELSNLEVVNKICEILEEIAPTKKHKIKNYNQLIRFVDDRPGHDIRYAIDSSKIKAELGWRPKENFDSGIQKTVEWFIKNKEWYKNVYKKTL